MLGNVSQPRSRTPVYLHAAWPITLESGLRQTERMRVESVEAESNRWEGAMPTAILIDADRAIKAGVRRQRADGRQPTRSQVLDLAGERDPKPELNAKTTRRLALVRAVFPTSR